MKRRYVVALVAAALYFAIAAYGRLHQPQQEWGSDLPGRPCTCDDCDCVAAEPRP